MLPKQDGDLFIIGTAMLLPPSDLRTVPILIEHTHSLWFDTGLIATIAQISKKNQTYAPFKTDVQEISRQTNCVPSAVYYGPGND
jgi:hypothetical protein